MNIDLRFREDRIELATNDPLFMQMYAANRNLELSRSRFMTSLSMFVPGFILVCLNHVFSMELTWKHMLGTILFINLVQMAISLAVSQKAKATFTEMSQYWFKVR